MGSRVRCCCVPGCNDTKAKRHRIPGKGECRDIWLHRINNEKLHTLDDESLKSYRVCDVHFENVCKVNNGRLKNGSLPTLELLDYERVDSDTFVPPSPPRKVVTPLKVKEAIEAVQSSTNQTSGSSPVTPVIRPQRVYRKRILDFADRNDIYEPASKAFREGPSTSGSEGMSSPFNFADRNDIYEPASKAFREGPSTSGSEGMSSPFILSKQKTKRVTSTLRQKAIFKATPAIHMAVKGQLRHLRRIARRAKERNLATKQKLAILQKSGNLSIWKDVSRTTLNFFQCQQRNQKLKPYGRRFTLEDKILALSILKQSGKGYRFLSKLFSLPNRKTLKKILNRIPLRCGINPHVFLHLKDVVGKMNNLDKNCVLMFDEISLNTGISYNSSNDCIEGLVDFGGSERRTAFADHALVFMLKGVHKSWKQPICYYFCEHTTGTADLIRIIKDVVRHVRETGLQIVATVCDQGATNSAAIKNFLKDTNSYCIKQQIENRYQGYLIDGLEIVHLFDCPHLLKGIRNALLQKDLYFKQNETNKVASWSHVVEMYTMDQQMGRFSQFPKLTDEHVLPHKIKKMKVKNCTQVFSRTVATAMKIRAEISNDLPPESPYYINTSASQTADLLLFFDEVFDSVNGNLLHPPVGKELRGVVTTKSKHIRFWQNSLPILQSMFFTSGSCSTHTVTPSLNNWIFTLRGFIYLSKILKDKGFQFFSPRSFNQDPLENYFSLVRSHGVRNTNPTCTSFISSTKALLINNLLSTHSPGSNCEEDVSTGVLHTFRDFINIRVSETMPISSNIIAPVYSDSFESATTHIYRDFATAYVAGVVAKKMLKKTNCQDCASIILTQETLYDNLLTERRKYRSKSLCTPSRIFIDIFQQTVEKVCNLVPQIVNFTNMKTLINQEIDINLVHQLFCPNHKHFAAQFVNILQNITIFHYVKIVNQILNGKDILLKNNIDSLTNLAFQKFLKKIKSK